MFISNSGLRKAKFRSTADNSLGVSTLAPFSVFKVDGGENLVPEPEIVDVSFVSNYDTLQIENGVIYGSKVKANLIDIHKIIIESEQEIQLTDCIGVWGITGYGTRYDHIGYISDNLEYIDFITPNKIDITKLFLDSLLRGIAINPIETCFYLRTSIDDDQTIYEITQTFTGRTKLGDPITVDVNDENVTINYDDLLTEIGTPNVSVSDNITTFVDLGEECTIIYDGEITDTLLLGAYTQPNNAIGVIGPINELISSGNITYNDNIITIPEGALGVPTGLGGFYCLFNVNFSDDGTTPTSINLVPTSYIVQETFINENPYYFETEGEHEVEFEYVNKFYPNLVFPRTNDYFSDSCIIELNDNFYDYYNDASRIYNYNIEKINLSNNVPEDIVEEYISHLSAYSNLKEININTDKYITINNCVIDKTNWSLVGYYGTDVVVPSLVKSIESSPFFNDSNLKTVVLPNGITTIPLSAFRHCSSLTSVNIPDSVTSIGSSAFSSCSSLTSITIPDSVTSIGSSAFYNCTSLLEITCNAPTAPTIESYTFYNVKTGGVLKVPTGATGYDAWMSTSNYYLGKYGWTIEYI